MQELKEHKSKVHGKKPNNSSESESNSYMDHDEDSSSEETSKTQNVLVTTATQKHHKRVRLIRIKMHPEVDHLNIKILILRQKIMMSL